MNKYHEALTKLLLPSNSMSMDIAIELLQELVDKATPKKPKEFNNLNNYFTSLCPNCNADDLDNYCKKCGQAIDWSDDE